MKIRIDSSNKDNMCGSGLETIKKQRKDQVDAGKHVGTMAKVAKVVS